MTVQSLRDALEESFDASEEDEQETVESPSDDESVEEPADAPDDGLDADESGDSPEEDAEPVEEDDAEEPEESAPREQDEGQAENRDSVAAPASWKPAAREEWKKLPRSVQEEVMRRERGIEAGLREAADARKFASQFQETIRPFEPLIAAQNSDPLTAVKTLMTTAAGLTIGTEQQKAKIIANMIQGYGVNVQVLDDLLVGEVQEGGGNGPDPSLQQYLQQELQPIKQFVGTIQQQRQQYEQNQQETYQQEIDRFAQQNEFYEDVRHDMADLMEVAAKRGQEMTLEEAYRRAVMLREDIQEVISKRNAAETAQQRQGRLRQKRSAASSVAGRTRAEPQGSGNDSWRGALEEAWEDSL